MPRQKEKRKAAEPEATEEEEAEAEVDEAPRDDSEIQSIVTCTDLVHAFEEGLRSAHPEHWSIYCTIVIDDLECDFLEDDIRDVWLRCVLPVLQGRYQPPEPGKLHRFELRPPPGEPILVPVRRNHRFEVRLRLPGPQPGHTLCFPFEFPYNWEIDPREGAFHPGWKDYFNTARLSLMSGSEAAVSGPRQRNQPRVNALVDDICNAARPHISVLAKRHLTPEQRKCIESYKSGATAPVFLTLQPEHLHITGVSMAVDPIVFAEQVISGLLQSKRMEGADSVCLTRV